MLTCRVLVFLGALVAAVTGGELVFPPNFEFGCATASYQIEGAWNVSDKGVSIWDTFTHDHPENILDASTGDVACDSYNNWERDIEIAKELGLHFYRFSLSWSRILPSGFTNQISEDGVRYYNQLIDGLLAAGIKPVVTLFHWDLPQRLQDLGGWSSPLSSDWFAQYSRVAYRLFSDRVDRWITINEPVVHCVFGYAAGWTAPGLKDPEVAHYLCIKHILLAHGKAYRIYDEEFRHLHGGKVSLSNHIIWYDGETEEDEHLAERARLYQIGLYSHPIYSETGGWPTAISDLIAAKSYAEGYTFSRLPSFTNDEIELLRGSYDFYGLNHYTSRTVRARLPEDSENDLVLAGNADMDLMFGFRDYWLDTASTWFKENPEGIRRTLVWLKNSYNNPEIFITENGYSGSLTDDSQEDLNDYNRIEFHKKYLEQVLLAINEDGVHVSGYTAWSLMDNFEWMDGYTRRFGLYAVNFSSPLRTRTPRLSASWYAAVVANNCIDVPTPEVTRHLTDEF